jgi:hypothetical protein
VKSKTTFETPDAALLEKVREEYPEEQSKIEPESKIVESEVQQPVEEEQNQDPFEAKGGYRLMVIFHTFQLF